MEKSISPLWIRWLLAVCVAGILFGIVLVIAPHLLDSTFGQISYNSFFTEDAYAQLTAPELAYQYWIFGVLGSAMIGWLLLIGLVAHIPFRRGERWAWTAITVSLLVWFVPDTITSLTHGVVINAFLNLGFLIAFGIPLAATYRNFYPRQ
jgi:hypothetical protein